MIDLIGYLGFNARILIALIIKTRTVSEHFMSELRSWNYSLTQACHGVSLWIVKYTDPGEVKSISRSSSMIAV